jgi:hypothetical protein
MSPTTHLPEKTLHLFVKNELPDDMKSVVRLHLSYCPLCQDQREELALKLSVQAMQTAYEISDSPDESHIEDGVFEKFYLEPNRDAALSKQISGHCIVCRDCRSKRDLVYTRIEDQQRRAFAAIVIATWRFLSWRRVLAGVTVLFIFGIGWLFLRNREITSNQLLGNVTQHPEIGPSINKPSPEQTPEPINNNQPTPPAQTDAPRDLLAQIQSIDLKHASEGAESRASNEQDSGQKSDFKLVPSQSKPTRFSIRLPANSKKGFYAVSILDSAFLNEVVRSKTKSLNGVNLVASINLQGLKPNDYIMRITRRDPESGDIEYIGDYRVFISAPVSKKPAP